jgi:hypothetical protein
MQVQSCGSPRALLYAALSRDLARPAHDHRGMLPAMETAARHTSTNATTREVDSAVDLEMGLPGDLEHLLLATASYRCTEAIPRRGNCRTISSAAAYVEQGLRHLEPLKSLPGQEKVLGRTRA